MSYLASGQTYKFQAVNTDIALNTIVYTCARYIVLTCSAFEEKKTKAGEKIQNLISFKVLLFYEPCNKHTMVYHVDYRLRTQIPKVRAKKVLKTKLFFSNLFLSCPRVFGYFDDF